MDTQNTDFGKRLISAMKRKSLSLREVSERTNINYEMIRRYSLGKATPRESNLKKIADLLGVAGGWLLFGGSDDKENFNLNEKINVDDWDSHTEIDYDEVEVPFFQSIELAAGAGCENNFDNNGFKLRFAKSFFKRKGVDKNSVICFPVHGESMTPNIPNKSTVAVDMTCKTIRDGDIYAICQSGLCRLKRLYRLPHNKVRINSYNSTDNPDEVDELDNIEIIGRVFHVSFEL